MHDMNLGSGYKDEEEEGKAENPRRPWDGRNNLKIPEDHFRMTSAVV